METITYTSAAGVVTRVLTNTYNGNGQLYSVHDSATGKTLYAVYDSLGRLVSADNGDVRVVYTYNAYNQLTPSGTPNVIKLLSLRGRRRCPWQSPWKERPEIPTDAAHPRNDILGLT